MFNRIFKLSALTFLAVVALFTSCQQDENLLIEDFTNGDQVLFQGCDAGGARGGHGGKGGPIAERCFDLVFPVTVEFPNGDTKEVASKEAYDALISTWRKDNPRSKNHPKIAFPYEIMLKDGAILTIETVEELKDILDDCRPNDHAELNPCYTLVFPVTLKFPDSTTAVANSTTEFTQLIQTWRTNNPNATGRPSIVFPYNIELADGSTVTVNSLDDIRELNHACRENRPHAPKCFTEVYPLTVIFPDSTEKEVADRTAFLEAVRTWRTANPTVKGHPTIKFPFSVTLTDGTVKIVNSKEELEAIAKACRG